MKFTSKKCPTNLSISLAVVLGAEQSTLCFLAYPSKNTLASSLSNYSGNFSPKHFSNSPIIETLGQGGVKSISIKSSSFSLNYPDFLSCSVNVIVGFASLWIKNL